MTPHVIFPTLFLLNLNINQKDPRDTVKNTPIKPTNKSAEKVLTMLKKLKKTKTINNPVPYNTLQPEVPEKEIKKM
jgi:hypothetical protein